MTARDTPRISNCRLFSEGVDVPNLSSVAFLDARDSQVDVVQAVGRVMRKAPGKKYGYIIVPVVVPPGRDVVDALETGSDGYRTVGRVLRALQAHDSRLSEDLESFIRVFDGKESVTPPPNGGDNRDGLQQTLDFERVNGDGIYARVAAASGLGRAGQLEAEEIAAVVKRVGTLLEQEHLEKPIADALDLVPEEAGGAKGVCRIGTLILANACLLQQRLRDIPELRLMLGPDRVGGAESPSNELEETWRRILERDYGPVFRPALAVLQGLGHGPAAEAAVSELHEAAGRLAQSLGTLGYDYAGPLYHRILGTAKSDGAFYTNNLSAVMLARLALTDDFTDWSDLEAVHRLRIMDPPCGTGTLLMAALQAVKAQAARAGAAAHDDPRLHRDIVENVLCGLDINAHAIQLAACNLTLGAPTVDYRRMNLGTMCTSTSGIAERRFLAERFHIDRIVTSHDPKRPNFSENTGIHKALLIATRKDAGSQKPTEFMSLARMPGVNAEPRAAIAETLKAIDAILSRRHDEWGSVCLWPEDRMRAGDWTPAQWYNGALAETVREIERNAGLEPVGHRFRVGPAGRRIEDAYDRLDEDKPGTVPGFHSVSSKLRRTLQGKPDATYYPKAGKTGLAAKYAAQRSHLLVAMKMDTIRIPKPDNPAWAELRDAFEQVKTVELLPMREAEQCPARRVIDRAATKALDVSEDVVAEWRRRIASEPTVSNKSCVFSNLQKHRDGWAKPTRKRVARPRPEE